ISKADVLGSTTQITYSFDGVAGHTYRLEFFGSDQPNQTGTPLEFGQGKVYLGFVNVSGTISNAIFTANQGLAPLWVVSATATDTTVGPQFGDTSEFSQAFYVNTPGPNTYVVNNDGGFFTTLGTPGVTVLNGTMTLARAIQLANQHPGTDRIFFA